MQPANIPFSFMAINNYDNDGGEEKKSPALEDYIIYEKVAAFAKKYRPVEEQTFTTEVFDEGRLREFFKAYVFPLGDPLKIYMQELAIKGFGMSVSVTGEPAILVEEIF